MIQWIQEKCSKVRNNENWATDTSSQVSTLVTWKIRYQIQGRIRESTSYENERLDQTIKGCQVKDDDVVSEENAMLFQVEITLKVIAEIRGELDGLIKTARDDQLIARKDNQKSIIQS